MRLRTAVLLLSSMLLTASDALSHPLPDSTIFLDVEREQVMAELRLPAAQFEIGYGKPVARTSAVFSSAMRNDIARYVAAHLSASDRDGTVWCTDVDDVRLVMEPGDGHSNEGVAHLYVTAALVPPSGATPRNFVLRTDVVVHELLTHRLYVYLRRDWKVGPATVEPFALGRITYRTSTLAVDLFE
jgi:hypothetical protein